MDTLTNIRAFIATAEKRSFSAAARQLGLMPSVVMKRVNQLENEFRCQLFQRSTRRVALTEAGETLLSPLKDILERFRFILESQRTGTHEVEGHLRIKMPTMLGRLWTESALSRFIAANRRLTFEIVYQDRSVNPVEENFDVAISIWPGTFRGVVEFPLQRYGHVLVASADYLKRKGKPENPRDLLTHDCLVMAPTGAIWTFKRGGRLINVEVSPRISLNDHQTLLRLACDGHGIAIGAELAAKPLVRAKKLVALMPHYPVADLWVTARVPETRVNFARVQALLKALQSVNWTEIEGMS